MNNSEIGFLIALLACIINGSWVIKKKKENNFFTKQFYKDAFGWGFVLWLIGYALGIILFVVVPPSVIGWVIMPVGIFITLWVLLKKIKGNIFLYYVLLAIAWVAIAIVFDYFFLVKIFKPEDGYYKLDVYVYYIITFILPLVIGARYSKELKNRAS